MNTSSISPAQLAELGKEGRKIELIDVRTPVEFREVHVAIARNVPLDRLAARASETASERSERFFFEGNVMRSFSVAA